MGVNIYTYVCKPAVIDCIANYNWPGNLKRRIYICVKYNKHGEGQLLSCFSRLWTKYVHMVFRQ